ncbi:MAG: tRNA (adenosine(37)-N6)-threonylcarbamoyltransferase complex dimerization subunit type 1 TsaB [Nitrospinota bacterium]
MRAPTAEGEKKAREVLGIETATRCGGVAHLRGGKLLGVRRFRGGGTGSRELLPAVHSLLAEAGVSIRAVDGLAVAVGPGLFTGIRVGVATAKGLALALGKPLVGVNCLEALAAGAGGEEPQVVSVLDAYRGEVFAASFLRREGGLERLTPDGLFRPDSLPLPEGGALRFVGDGAHLHGGALARRAAGRAHLGEEEPVCGGLCVQVARLGEEALRRGGIPLLGAVQPHYVRRPEALLRWEQRAALTPGRGRLSMEGC